MQTTCKKKAYVLSSTHMKKYSNLILHSIALIAVIILAATHFEYNGLQTIVFVLLSLVLGYWFGKWTCHFHKKQNGFWITVGIFALLNLLHSMIDGASVGTTASVTSTVALLAHEFARQPALYIVLWGMLTPFVWGKQYRIFIVPVMVSGVWFIGAYLGYELLSGIDHSAWLEPIADMAVFLFLGDIMHHLYEEYHKLRHPNDCCHV